jgi:hypothetical protein
MSPSAKRCMNNKAAWNCCNRQQRLREDRQKAPCPWAASSAAVSANRGKWMHMAWLRPARRNPNAQRIPKQQVPVDALRFGATMRRGADAMMDPAETTWSECAKAWDTRSLPASRRPQVGRTGWRTHEPPTAAACARGAPASTRHSLRRGAACKPTPTCSVNVMSLSASAQQVAIEPRPQGRALRGMPPTDQ